MRDRVVNAAPRLFSYEWEGPSSVRHVLGRSMPDFAEVARLDQTKPGTATLVTVRGDAVALFNVEGRLFAVDDSCVRCGSSLALGTLHGVAVACPGCNWQYDVTNGRVHGVPALCIDTFEVRIEDSQVMVATAPACHPR